MGALTRVGHALLQAGRWLAEVWRRSLHTRVVTVTALSGVVVVVLVGSYMYQRIADGLVSAKISSTEQDSQAKRLDAQRLFSAVSRTDPTSLRQTAEDVVAQEASPGSDLSRRVVLIKAIDNPATTIGTVTSGSNTQPEVIPIDLRRALARDPTHQQMKIVSIPETRNSTVPAVVVGSRISVPNAGAYDIYFVYPMDSERQSLDIVQNSFAIGGLLLIFTLALLAYFVTRMVVTPVRGARHAAERLAAGALNERMRVKGDDDLARLAVSFNAMADSLQRQIRQLEDLSNLQQRFTSDVSHELRTPLTTVRMAAELIYDQREDFTAPVARSAELLHRELDHFEVLLTDLLEISRFDAGAATMTLEPVDVRDIVTRVVDSSVGLAQRHHTRLRVSARVVAIAPVDQRRIERVIRNLVNNAIEHCEGRPIDIMVGANSTAVAVTVRDYGIGLRPGEQEKVFNRFWRADPARARTIGGTGLGLSIALEDARLHEGWLEAWGEPGEGACFRLTLPARRGVPIRRSPLALSPDDSKVGLRVDPPPMPAAPTAVVPHPPRRWTGP